VKRNTPRAPTAATPSMRRFPFLGARTVPVALAIALGARAIAARRMAELYSCFYRIRETGRLRHAIACSAFEADRPATVGSDRDAEPSLM
jgi:hypothetical protein